MKIPAHGKVWLVPHPARVLESPARYLLGCGRCATTCTGVDPCRCCQNYKKRTAGGTQAYYPEDDNGHRQLMPMSAFRAMTRDEVPA